MTTKPAPALLKAAPDGYNSGYASRLADKITTTYQDNPLNMGRIEIMGKASPIQPKSYLEEHLFYVSKTEWEKRKASGGL